MKELRTRTTLVVAIASAIAAATICPYGDPIAGTCGGNNITCRQLEDVPGATPLDTEHRCSYNWCDQNVNCESNPGEKTKKLREKTYYRNANWNGHCATYYDVTNTHDVVVGCCDCTMGPVPLFF